MRNILQDVAGIYLSWLNIGGLHACISKQVSHWHNPILKRFTKSVAISLAKAYDRVGFYLEPARKWLPTPVSGKSEIKYLALSQTCSIYVQNYYVADSLYLMNQTQIF